jgi:methylated-DNA-[protein]-cysteine S-methyltransferase
MTKEYHKSFCIQDNDVYELLLNIPAGRVSTYGDIAKALGYSPAAARTVGKILNKSPISIIVPCHRIIQSNGKIGGYKYGIVRKRELLKREGINFKMRM